MPFYLCIAPDDLLTPEAKTRIATGITDIHCGLTGAPRQFVHVVFQLYAPEDAFAGGKPSRASMIRAHIRAGRTQEVKEDLLRQLTQLWLDETGIPPASLLVSLIENSGTNVMEGGVLLPHPKDDAQWMLEHAAAAG